VPGEGLLEVGRIVKPHGLRGELVVALVTDRTERLDPGSILESDRGRLTVVTSRPHQGRYVVRFEEVPDRDRAEEMRGVALLAPPIEDPDALWVHELIGASVVLGDGRPVGTVSAVEASGADDLLLLDSGAVIPIGFVEGWDDQRRLVIDPPAGLLDL
jgi:16S rRNA processing protein RimM